MRKETTADHAVHKGEAAILIVGYCSVAHPDTHALAQAVDRKDAPRLEAMVASGKALTVENRTRVKVLGESYNEREIEILNGPMQGKKGWVPFEWLRPAV